MTPLDMQLKYTMIIWPLMQKFGWISKNSFWNKSWLICMLLFNSELGKVEMTAHPILTFNHSVVKFQIMVPEIQMKRAKASLSYLHTYIVHKVQTDYPSHRISYKLIKNYWKTKGKFLFCTFSAVQNSSKYWRKINKYYSLIRRTFQF